MGRPAQAAAFLLQDAATSGNGKALDFGGKNVEAAVYIKWSAGVSAGQVTIETADKEDYTGTWASLNLVINFGTDKQDIAQISGCLRALRARISSTIVGGTVTVTLAGA